MRRIAILGAGSWGTAIALHLARNGHGIHLWDRDVKRLHIMRQTKHNPRYLSGFTLPDTIHVQESLADALKGCAYIFLAIPSAGFIETLHLIKPLLSSGVKLCWGSKGLVEGELLHTAVQNILGGEIALAAVSGPSFAAEVAAGLPTAITVASTDTDFARELSHVFHSDSFRPYISHDVVGVEICGVVKNVLAIATGISDGLGFGANARSALITRGLAEMVRLGTRLGGQQETFYGLAGVGDLILTATDNQSRNRRFGLALGQGIPIDEATAQIGQVVEGVRNTREIFNLAARLKVEMPICREVYAVIYEHQSPKNAVINLLSRYIKAES